MPPLLSALLQTLTEGLVAAVLNATDIQAGQGLYYETITGSWRAKDCANNSYGVTNVTFGLAAAPCRSCPANMVASRSAAYSTSAAYYTRNADNTGGFISPLACVTAPGVCL